MNNLYVSTTFIKDGQTAKIALDILKSAGIKNVELGSNHVYESNYNYIKNYDFNFLIHNYFPTPKKDFIINIASLNKKVRDKSFNQIKRSINFYKNIGARIYTFHPGFISDPVRTNNSQKNYDFIWKKKKIKKNYTLAFKHMLISLKKIVDFAKKKNVRIAIETEGSFRKKYLLLMQRSEEYRKIFKFFNPRELGVNLNIGHLNLASKAFKFSKTKFVDEIKDYIIAIEVSHNNGFEDEHLPIKKNAWYWKILNNKKFIDIPKILEFRNCNINKIKKSIDLLKKSNEL